MISTNLETNQHEPIETIVNPVTGDRMTILQSADQSQGNTAKIRFDLPPGAQGSPLHYHTEMDETFTVLQGCLTMEVCEKGQVQVLQAGDRLHVSAGVHHSFCNASDDWVSFTTENNPAMGFEQFIRGLYGLAIDGKVNADGMPTNFLEMAILLRLSDTVPVGISSFLFSLVLNALVWIAQILKVDRTVMKYWR
ncbi:cupin domain-containing protein [Almyronema epifaneia]|uniref:Cupin domain-containing protein n=1 Tax=Almyronema epifaneia S1 TaxID=2991925 RepID=A0ABW6IK10_9CYAN